MSINAFSNPKIGFDSLYQKTPTGWQEFSENGILVNKEMNSSKMREIVDGAKRVQRVKNVLLVMVLLFIKIVKAKMFFCRNKYIFTEARLYRTVGGGQYQ